MKNYEVNVVFGSGEINYLVNADNEIEAQEKALELAKEDLCIDYIERVK